MENLNLSYRFVDILTERIPHKSVLANQLADLLDIEKESVYRRLRKEIPFTFNEVGIIATQLGLSLDKLVNVSNVKECQNYIWESYEEYYLFQPAKLINFNRFLPQVLEDGGSEAGFIMNTFDPFFFSNYNNLSRFILFKWMYKYRKELYTHYEEVEPDAEYQRLRKECIKNLLKLEVRSYIFDPNILVNFINDIRYFMSIHLIEEESIQCIKEDLFRCLFDLEQSALQGTYMDTDKVFELYIADISIGQCCSYIGSGKRFMSVLIAFEMLTCMSWQQRNFETVKNWYHRVKGLSTQISISGEKNRLLFFDEQRVLLDGL